MAEGRAPSGRFGPFGNLYAAGVGDEQAGGRVAGVCAGVLDCGQLRPEVFGVGVAVRRCRSGAEASEGYPAAGEGRRKFDAIGAVSGFGVQNFILSGNPGCNDDMLLSPPRYLVCRPGALSLRGFGFSLYVQDDALLSRLRFGGRLVAGADNGANCNQDGCYTGI